MESFDLSKLSFDEKKIYKLIAERYLIQFLEKIEVEKTEAEIEIDGNIFKQSSVKQINPGYTKYFNEIKEEDNVEEENKLSELPEGLYNVLLNQEDFHINEKETKPKKHYTEATLLIDMKNIAKYIKNPEIKEILKLKDKGKEGINGSIGTAATRGPIIQSLFDKGYLKKEDKNIVATELAKEYLKILPESLKTADATALWWNIQQEIIDGKAEVEDLTLSVLEDVKKIINSSENIKISSKVANQNNKERESFGICPKCKKGKIYSSEKNFYCSEYKSGCNFSLFKKMKIYGQKEVDITDTRAKTLLAGQSILINKVPSKSGKEYDAYFKLEIKDKFINLIFDKFKETKKK